MGMYPYFISYSRYFYEVSHYDFCRAVFNVNKKIESADDLLALENSLKKYDSTRCDLKLLSFHEVSTLGTEKAVLLEI